MSGVQIAVFSADCKELYTCNTHQLRFRLYEIQTTNSHKGSAGASQTEMGTRHDG